MTADLREPASELLTGLAGLPAIAALARIFDLPWILQKYVRIKVRQRGSSDAQNLLSLIFRLCPGGGYLDAVDALAADEAACEGTGLCKAPCPTAAASAST